MFGEGEYMIDFNALADQKSKEYGRMDYENIMPLHDYHSWNIHVDGVKQRNPEIDKVTNHILNIKKKENSRVRAKAVTFYCEVVKSTFLPLLDNSERSFCVVPSHDAGHVSKGLLELVSTLTSDFNFQNRNNLLARTITVEKAATGGSRRLEIHQQSIESKNLEYISGKDVILFDDVSSTGNSLRACREILIQAGARRVAMIALGQTV